MRLDLKPILVSVLVLALLSGCSFAPKNQRPFMPIPPHYKQAGPWLMTKSPVNFSKNKPWWQLFQDQTLNQLEEKVTCSNENLKVAVARYDEALAVTQAVRSALYPQINGIINVTRQHDPSTVINNLAIRLYNTFLLGTTLTYELDAWGRVRNAVKASASEARASLFDLATINLSSHAELAQNYFELRGNEAGQRVLDETVQSYEKVLFLTRKRFEGGAAPEIDVDQAKTQFENAKSLAIDFRLKHAQLEHAIAVLTGEIPANFILPQERPPITLVTIAPKLPSLLLRHRPDVAAAEEHVKTANATIGVARAAFFPDFNLSAVIGVQSNQINTLFNSPSLYWALGPFANLALAQPLVTQPLFEGFKLQALLKRAKASYYETVSAYRQTVLTAFQEVEDNLVAINRLDQEIQTQTASTVAAKRALYQAKRRYSGGIATYLDIVITENQALQSELALVNLHTRRQIASVQLIKALGGGWGSSCC